MRISDFSGALERIKIKLLFCTLGIVGRDCISALSDNVVHSAEPALTLGVTW